MTTRRWAWAEIDLGAIAHNVRALRGLTTSDTRLMAVVKADGYGHGAVQVAQAALAAGATHLGVATADEALALRSAGIAAPVLVLSEFPDTMAPEIVARGITATVFTHDLAYALARAAAEQQTSALCHVKIDTGMNRVGVHVEDVAGFVSEVLDIPGLEIEGVFTHIATADGPTDWDVERQLERFEEALRRVRVEGLEPSIVHAANSPATILYPESHYDMVRCGIALYGLQPSHHTRGRVDLIPAMSVKARATLVKKIGMGEGVSYGLTWQAAAPATIATLPLGYADGVHRVLSCKMKVLVGGRRAEQVGRICMDQLMVEVPRSIAAQRGDEFVLVGRQDAETITLDELADVAGTINYEMACAFGMRLPRVYLD